eukprot:CAMPEP_0114557820 /NCGR_PEP_ID=MMETSP0114-20121206/10039_1 /TAXON_ID=31324 /ORGANISM="Goniomonas sp, Strain m" /LENGTH=395 /DNA_ID=CAMNT_0001743143 /DNA_START=17 /DNA_END=1204 /DNA_ORIENTATION=+
MGLEATVVCVDNSEWMRNGDYSPNNRLEAMTEAINVIIDAKTGEHPESTVGLISMAGRSPEVLVSPTSDLGKLLACLGSVNVNGVSNFSASIQIAQLCLKHRQNKYQKQRIVAFVGSPLKDSVKDLQKLGAKLRKVGVAVDIVNFGEAEENTEKLEQFINAVNSQENSTLLTVPVGPHRLSGIVLTSKIVFSEEFSAMAGTGAGGDSGAAPHPFGVDPNIDPEMAMALRLSMEEEERRQQQQTRAAEAVDKTTTQAPGDGDAMEDDEETLLAQAVAMSMEGAQAAEAPAPQNQDVEMPDGDDDALQLALQMSMEQSSAPPAAKAPAEDAGEQKKNQDSEAASAAAASADAALADPAFLSSVLGSLPGVDPSDPRVKGVLEALDKKDEDKKDEDKK